MVLKVVNMHVSWLSFIAQYPNLASNMLKNWAQARLGVISSRVMSRLNGFVQWTGV